MLQGGIDDEIRKPVGKYRGGGADNVPVPYMKADGSLMPRDTKRIWPHTCNSRRQEFPARDRAAV